MHTEDTVSATETLRAEGANSSAARSATEGNLLMLPREAASHLRISVATLLRLSRTGEIPEVRVGKLWRYRKSALDKWLES